MRRRLILVVLAAGCSRPAPAPEATASSAAQASALAPPAGSGAAPAALAGRAEAGRDEAAGRAGAGGEAAGDEAAGHAGAGDEAAGRGGKAVTEGGQAGCPGGTTLVPGGVFWMGTSGQDEESPRHRVAVRSFCLGTTEVTVDGYQRCQAAGRCDGGHQGKFLCNGARADRADHPINCLDWEQARALCSFGGGRLPTEREWEYAARGGAEQRSYPWGPETPEGRACYDHVGTCKVGSYPPGAFGLLDMGGNVWEWTASTFGPYPAEAPDGPFKVYRGGSFSRRFPKWLRSGLRNRFRAEEWGAHLGVRCAADLAGASCPAGSQPAGAGCEPDGSTGAAGAPAAPRAPVAGGSDPVARAAASGPEPPRNGAPLTRTRDPQFDADCVRWKPGRPVCYTIRGGGFAERQQAKGSCVNRDVGVGYNSVCCAQ